MGFRAFYVNTLRQHDAASMIIGDPGVAMGRNANAPYALGDLPPGQAVIHRQATCRARTSSFSEPIHVFTHLLHMVREDPPALPAPAHRTPPAHPHAK